MRTTFRARAAAVAAALVTVTIPLLAGCGGSAEPPASSPGSSSTPGGGAADPGVVVALDDFAAVTVLTLGVTPDLAFDTFGYDTNAALYEEFGITPQPYGQELDIEKIIAADPDVIVGVSLPTTVAQQETLEKLGTTAILDYTGDWTSALDAAAAALGRQDRATAIKDRIGADIEALTADLAAAGLAGSPVSVIAGSTDDFFSPPVKTNLGSLIDEVGLGRPEPQRAEVAAAAPFVDISPENLTANDGAALYLLEGNTYPVDRILSSPLYPLLRAVQDERAFRVSAEMWFGANPLGVQWVLDDLRATLLDGGDPLAEDQVGERLRQLTAES